MASPSIIPSDRLDQDIHLVLEDVASELAELDRLSHYPFFGRSSHGADAEKLRSAIDDYVGEMTGDRTKLHTGSSRLDDVRKLRRPYSAASRTAGSISVSCGKGISS